MKVLFGVLLSAYLASAAEYRELVQNSLGDVPVTTFHLPGFVDKKYTAEEEEACRERLGEFVNGEFQGPEPNYNISQILRQLGGAPGEVEAVRNNNVGEASVSDPNERPLDDAPKDKWLYDYKSTDYKYYFRVEHGVKRFAGTPKEFVDVRGRLAWTPEDTCGKLRVAEYRLDDTGFSANLKHESCWLDRQFFTCTTIPTKNVKADGSFTVVG